MLAHAERLARDGRVAEAYRLMQQAVALHPDNAAIQHDVGLFCLQTGQVVGAISAFRAALAVNPRFAQASFNLGLALQADGRAVEAIIAYNNAAALLPSLVEAWFRAAALFESLGHRAEAIAGFRRAAAAAPKSALGRLAKARLLIAEDRDADAEVALRQLLALDPDNALAADMLGVTLANAGHFEEARGCHERAIALAPWLAGSYYDLARCRPITPEDADLVERMRIALASSDLPPESRIKIHLALGKAADDLGDPACAMQHFDAADALRSSFGAFALAAFDARIERLVTFFTPEYFTSTGDAGFGDATPVLITGLPRSGTTLVEQILSCHPDVHASGELPFWTERGSSWEQQPPGPDAAFLADAATDYLTMLRALAPQALRVTDKMPLNLIWAGLIHTALPRATVIHCRRSPIDTALSIHRTYFNQHVAFPTGGKALVAFMRAVERLVAHWQAVLPPDRFIQFDYEDLVADPEPAIRRLIAACGLSWNSACLHPERNPRVVKTPSKWQARQPITRCAVGAWRRYEPWLGPLAALLK